MEVYVLTGNALRDLTEALTSGPVYQLSVAIDDGGFKAKINHGPWSHPMGQRIDG